MYNIRIVDGSFRQTKTHKNPIINWIYAKLYGYDTVYPMEDGKIAKVGDTLYMTPKTYKSLNLTK